MQDDFSSTQHHRLTQPSTRIYQFRVESHLNPAWSTWFEDLTLSHEPDGTTCLTGQVEDQEALHGILIKIRDLGLTLISVQRLDAEDVSGL